MCVRAWVRVFVSAGMDEWKFYGDAVIHFFSRGGGGGGGGGEEIVYDFTHCDDLFLFVMAFMCKLTM